MREGGEQKGSELSFARIQSAEIVSLNQRVEEMLCEILGVSFRIKPGACKDKNGLPIRAAK